jgi:DNA polymerase zeta
MEADHRDEPQYGERIPFVVHAGDIEKKSISARSIEVPTLLYSEHLVLDADYYIEKKIIPPLARIFNLVGANVLQWYRDMPKYRRVRRIAPTKGGAQRKGKGVTLDKWLASVMLECALCRRQIQRGESRLSLSPKTSSWVG